MTKLKSTVMEGVAKVAESVEANKVPQSLVEQKLGEVETKIVGIERDFFSRVFPLFAAFVAAFALIVTGAQASLRAPAADPTLALAQSAALMAPVTVAVLVVVVARIVSR